MFSCFAVLSLALGIGVPTAVWSVVYGSLWRPIGVVDSGAVVTIGTPARSGGTSSRLGPVSLFDYRTIAAGGRTLRDLAASARRMDTIEVEARRLTIQFEIVSGSYFTVVGRPALMGRLIDLSDEVGDMPVAVVSHSFWRERMNSNANVLGATLRVSAHEYQVVGVMSTGFDGLVPRGVSPTAVWLPLTLDNFNENRLPVSVFGRLNLGVARGAVDQELTAIAAHGQSAPSAQNGSSVRLPPRQWISQPLAELDRSADGAARSGTVIIAVMCLVLLVASTNLANLVLARSATERRQVAIRQMLGASRLVLVREQLAETLIIAGMGGLASIGVASLLLQLWTADISVSPSQIIRFEYHVDSATMAFSACASALSLVVFGLLPALYLTEGRHTALRTDGHVTSLPRTHWILIRWQVATSVGLLLVAAACISAVTKALRHDSGIDMEHLVVVNTDLGASGKRIQAASTLRLVLRGALDQGQVAAASLSSGLPFGINAPLATVSVADDLQYSSRESMQVLVAATGDIFATLGVPLLRGRTFDERLSADSNGAVVLSARSAVDLFGDIEVIGRRVRVTSGPISATRTVVGVAGDTDVVQFSSRNGSVLYVPLSEPYPRSLALVARAIAEPPLVFERLLSEVGRSDPELQIELSGVASVLLTGPLGLLRFAMLLVSTLGVMTMLLAVTGLYGVLSLAVTQRMPEIGVRVALGASTRTIERLIVLQGLRPVLEGLAVGLTVGLVVRLVVNRLLDHSVPIFEPISWIAAALPMCVVALVACYAPARRAGRTNPNVVLHRL